VSIRVAIEHRTAYRFDREVEIAPHVVRLRPAPHCRTPILAYSLTITPAEHFINWQQDPAGNHIARLVFPKPARELSLTVDLVAEMTPFNPFDFFLEEASGTWPLTYDPALSSDLAPYLATEPAGPLLTQWLHEVPKQDAPIIDFLVDLNRRVLAHVAYSVRLDPGVHTPDDTLQKGVASCRDSAWLLVQALRNLGVAARFASGYLIQLRPDDLNGGGATEDFTDLHAWAEAYVPGAGWIGLDPTSGLFTGEGHIPLACTSAPAAAAPIEGSTGVAQVEFEFANAVKRVHEPPRVTKPYTEAQWHAIDALGNAVDTYLADHDVRLTMGGEPTFVSTADMESPEWNTAALGGDKHELGLKLVDRLKPEGSLVLHGQGKWYPGEPLPRWVINVFWRLDGHPLWRDPRLLADPSTPGDHTPAHARALAVAIGAALGLDETAWYPAYEDPVERLLQEARLPAGDPPQLDEPDPSDGDVLDNGQARAQLIARLDSERGDPAGWVLPLRRAPGDEQWFTGRWLLRRAHLLLMPGDSPVGLRLPLQSLTWTPPEPDPEQSLFRSVSPLAADLAARASARMHEPPPVTALCIELREGRIHVFLPPLKELEHAAELIATIEAAAAGCALEVVVEGYSPPRDVRISSFGVAPDPGVLEVNIHPSGSWRELVERGAWLVGPMKRPLNR
jgi:transglutaminase-like putative cysteine protease